MAVGIIGGSSGTGAAQGVTAELLKLDREDRIWHLEPQEAPLLLMLRQLPKGTAKAVKVEWLETEYTPQYDAINNGGGYAPGDTALVVDNAAYFAVNSLFTVQRTGETCLVTAVDTGTNTLTVVRSFGTTPAAALLDDDALTRTGGAAEENAQSEESRQVQEVNQFNNTQIFKSPFGASRSLQESDVYGPRYMSRIASERGTEHKRDMEMALFFGERANEVGGSFPRRAMGGVKEWITTNNQDFLGTVTIEELFAFSQNAHRYGNSTKSFFVSRAASTNITLVAEGDAVGKYLRVNNRAKDFGLSIKILETPHGVWNIISHPLFEGVEHAKIGFSIDMKMMQYASLRNSDTKLKMNIQENDRDGEKHEWLTEMTLKRRHERTAAQADNLA